MPESRGGGSCEGVHPPTRKRVTFSGPITSTRAERPRATGTESTGARHRTTVGPGLPKPISSHDPHRKPMPSERAQSTRVQPSRPHSKTTVLGTPFKTRLNCDHMRPKCQCSSNGNKRKVVKARHRKAFICGPRPTLVSTRSLPRGEVNGRKTYQEKGSSISVLDGNWQPGLEACSNGNGNERSNNYGVIPDGNKENVSVNGSNNAHKKKVKFADNVSKDPPSSTTKTPERTTNSTEVKRDDGSHSTQHHEDLHPGHENVNSRPDPGESGYRPEPNMLSHDNTSLTNSQSDYCRLCELARLDGPEESLYTRNINPQFGYIGKNGSHYFDNPELVKHLRCEPCLLCKRYGKDHYYINDEKRCELCERGHQPYSSPGMKEGTTQTFSRTRPPLHRQSSAPGLFTESWASARLGIPYEPRTDLVRDLKKRLEAEYHSRDHQVRRRNDSERHWRSWDAEDVIHPPSSPDHHHCHTHPWDPKLDHKCVHRYQQNERLFLEPTMTDSQGASVCGECGAPQPPNPNTHPYLYHITLGTGVNHKHDEASKVGETRGRAVKTPIDCRMNENNTSRLDKTKSRTVRNHSSKAKVVNFPNKCNPSVDTSKHIFAESSSDTSKHVYAKLNSNISNILPNRSGYWLRPQSTNRLHLTDAHTKRPPGKSMALVDHLV